MQNSSPGGQITAILLREPHWLFMSSYSVNEIGKSVSAIYYKKTEFISLLTELRGAV